MIYCENLVKIYKTKELEVLALQGLDLNVEDGEMIAVIGNSGSGKSTLLNMLGGIDRPSAGKLFVANLDLLKLTDSQLVKYKRETVGFVWQNNARNLIPYLSALENIEMPMMLTGKQDRSYAKYLLDIVGLTHRKNNRLAELSGGEQQRVAISLSIANKPKLLLADEPTGSVDTVTANSILDVFRQINKDLGVTIVIVTHDRNIARKVDRVVEIRDGRTSTELLRRRNGIDDESINTSINMEESHQQVVVVDNVGRLQLPPEMIASLGLEGRSRVVVEFINGNVVINKYKED